MRTLKIHLEPGEIEERAPLEKEVIGAHEKIEALRDKGPLPYQQTRFETIMTFFAPFLKYVFNLKPAIPNIIYMAISIIGIQLLNIKALMPEDMEWLQQVLFWGLFASMGVQILFASAKSISIPIIVIIIAAGAVWLETRHGVKLPIAKDIFQYMVCLGIFGVIVSSVFNH